MKNNILVILFVSLCSCNSCKGQSNFGEKYLQLQKTIVLPNVTGRIDHMAVNVKENIVYVAALGNNTLEAVDLRNGRIIHSIHGQDEPQGVEYIPRTHEIFVANGGNGDCYFYNASTFEKTATIHLPSDADDVRYDSASNAIFVGYGEGGIAIINANTHRQTADVKLPAHPEGFQIDSKANSIWVNVPDKNMIGVIDLVQLKLVKSLKRNSPSANFPMSIDVQNHRAFIGYRHPAKLVVVDMITGKDITWHDMVSDVDDLYYDMNNKRVYISGGGGFINIFQQDTAGSFTQITNMPTRSAARTSLLIPQLRLFVLAEREVSGNSARLLVYDISH